MTGLPGGDDRTTPGSAGATFTATVGEAAIAHRGADGVAPARAVAAAPGSPGVVGDVADGELTGASTRRAGGSPVAAAATSPQHCGEATEARVSTRAVTAPPPARSGATAASRATRAQAAPCGADPESGRERQLPATASGVPAGGGSACGPSRPGGTMIEVPVSWGELLDKLTILEIKVQRLVDPRAIANVVREHDLLRERCGALLGRPDLAPLIDELRRINRALWEIEDEIRDHEQRGEFGPSFIALARSVYRTNDRRAALKRALNVALESVLVEEKSYAAY